VQSITRTIDIFAPQDPTFEYVNDFESPTTDFVGNGFHIGGESGFSGNAIHSDHPYSDGQTLIYTLTRPIRVSYALANVEFDEIAIVEPGDPGTEFGDSAFWDYVSVEASLDGLVWTALDGWDAGAHAEWLAAYPSAPSPSLFRPRSLDLTSFYSPNDVVLLRFKLYADSYVNGWGWVIDNLAIQVGAPTDVAGTVPKMSLAQNVPNPFNATTRIFFTLPRGGETTLRIYDVRGRVVRTLLNGPRSAGPQSIDWNGRNDNGANVASGVYFYRLHAEGQLFQRKMTLLK
jgi:hypothetical protein